MNDLIEKYKQTLYKVNGFKQPIIVGKRSEEADNYLAKTRTKNWIYITAYNPKSDPTSESENESQNYLLKEKIKNYPFEEGTGVDPEEIWPGEKSFFVAGISKSEAKKLAREFGQTAIVYGDLGRVAELIITIG